MTEDTEMTERSGRIDEIEKEDDDDGGLDGEALEEGARHKDRVGTSSGGIWHTSGGGSEHFAARVRRKRYGGAGDKGI